MPEELCKLCEGAGLRVVERPDGTRAAVPCECRAAKRSARMIAQARIPQRYAHCTLESYEAAYTGAHGSLCAAFIKTHEFLEKYSLRTKGGGTPEGGGLLFVGKPGLGKTHLSVGLLRALIQKGAQGLFVDYRDLLKQVQNSYNPAVSTTELGILNPVFAAEVLVIDDLGASKPTDWVFDTVAHILNSRYNDQLTTIITTNFSNRSERTAEEIARMNEAQRIMSERTLGDRIGDRVLSRLQEMCMVVEMTGEDFRQKVKRAAFAQEKVKAAAMSALGATDETKSVAGVSSRTSTAIPEEDTMPNDSVDKTMKKEIEEGTQRSNAQLSPDKVWTQEDIDREVELMTRLKESRSPLD